MIGRELRLIIQNNELHKEHENASGGLHIWINMVIHDLHADPLRRESWYIHENQNEAKKAIL